MSVTFIASNSSFRRLLILSALGWLIVLQPGLSRLAVAQEAEPTKADLIKTLESAFALLEKRDFSGASEHFVLPPNFKPEMLDGMIKKREISAAGVRCLAKDAKFGTGAEVFGSERAKALADRSGADASKMYGFYHETEEATAEVLGVWDGKKFKLARLDDVGKLTDSTAVAPAKTNPSGSAAAKMEPPTAEEMAAAESARRAKLANSVATFSAHLETNPDDVVVRAKYAQALFGMGNTPESWKQLMIARKQAPDNKGLAGGMDMLINAFTKHGIFTVGVPTETIESLLGEPTQKHESKTRTRYVYGHWSVDFVEGRVHQINDLRGLTAKHFSPQEIVDVDLDGAGRRCGFRRTTQSTVSAYYFKPGETIANHTEQFAVERYPAAANGSMRDVAERVIINEKKLIPGIEHKVLATDEKSMMIAVKIPGPGGDKTKDRHQLVRLMLGDTDLHRITFTIVSQDAPTQETQMKWFKLFQAAKLTDLAAQKKESEEGAKK